MGDLQGEVALVTGASRGIGAAIALELGRRGAYVVATGTSRESVENIAKSLKENTIDGRAELLDVTRPEAVDGLMSALEGAGRGPSILVNNAGITRDNLLMRMKDEDWAAIIETNLTSVYRMSKACARGMARARKGRIITISSVVGAAGNAGQSNYAAAKAGVLGFTRALARELASRDVTVNAVAPGFIDTDMTRALSEEHKQALLRQIPLGRLGQPQDVAHAVAFLASPQAAYITGVTLHVNGGMYMT